MIDSHCHLTDPRLFEQLAGVLQRAEAAGVVRMLTIGTGSEEWAGVIDLARRAPQVRCAVGLHPNHVSNAELDRLAELPGLLGEPVVLAAGEMGLDYFYDTVPKALQRSALERQLEMARAAGKPVVIHSREATEDCLAILRGFPEIAGVFHCFTGSADEARRILDAGFYIGFTGPITFKKNDALREVVRLAPMDRLLVETDAPYLTPEPMRRQKINEPAMVMHVAAMVGHVKGLTVAEVDRMTTENCQRLFR
ncbi:MAG TPA: TatD family hydrolase [Tepidisphaeraceae bacterium]|jgi:TatD DNase family protein|nr:TatD family hydrolase [Tepidisphaeraceae bacterium]